MDQHLLAIDRANVGSGRQHGDHHLGVLDRLGHRWRSRTTGLHRARHGGVGQVEGLHRVLRLGLVGGHPAAHVAEADESDAGHDRVSGSGVHSSPGGKGAKISSS